MIREEDVTIIIPHLGADEQQQYSLEQCLTSLLNTCEANIIVATNGVKHEFSGDNSRIKHIHVEDQGQCKAVNAAAATANTPWIFVTNDDMIYAPGWFIKLTASNPKHFICPNLVEPRRGAPPFLEYFCGGAGGDFDYSKWIEFGVSHHEEKIEDGFNLPFLIKKDVWDTIGGYDVNYDPWGSNGDSDLQAKLVLAGVETKRERNCLVYHFSQTSGTFLPENHAYWEKNYAYFKDKWGFDRQPTDKVWYSEDIIDWKNNHYHPWWEKYKFINENI